MTYAIFEKYRNWNSIFFKQVPKYSLRERNRNETKVVEEYRWTIT